MSAKAPRPEPSFEVAILPILIRAAMIAIAAYVAFELARIFLI
jgi:hypothetical protein